MIRRHRRGYMIFFLLVMIPGLLLGLALSADSARLIMASHQAGTVADNVVMAGATGIDDSNELLDTRVGGLAWERSLSTFNMAKKTGMIPSSLAGELTISELTAKRMTVRVSYTVSNLLIIGWFTGKYSAVGNSTRSAGPCVSGEDSESCAYLA